MAKSLSTKTLRQPITSANSESSANAARSRLELQIACVSLRVALGVGLLSAVADRFGLWGSPGQPSVAWGNFGNFLVYTAKLNPWCPSVLIPALGWFVTFAESALGVGLLIGFRLRLIARFTAIMLTLFAVAMTMTLGVHAPLNYSVFAFAAGAFLLSAVTRFSSKQTSPDLER